MHSTIQAQQAHLRKAGPCIAGSLEDRLDVAIGEDGYHGGHHHAHRHARMRKALDGTQAGPGACCPGLEAPGQFVVQRDQAQVDCHQPCGSKLPQEIEVTQHQRGLGDEAHRMTPGHQHLQHGSGDSQGTFDGLVAVGGGAERDDAGPVAGLGEALLQQGCGIGLGHQSGFEVEARREPQLRMAFPGIAIDAAMLAAPIGVGAIVEGHPRWSLMG